MKFLLAAAMALTCCSITQDDINPDAFSATVVGVSEGDTITVLTPQKAQIKVRLNGIDAPELGQSYGRKSKEYLSELVFDKQVTIKPQGADDYGRLLGDVLIGNRDINRRIVRDGWAWHLKRSSNDKELAKAEQVARVKKVGLWADSNTPVAPWDYRDRQPKAKADSKSKWSSDPQTSKDAELTHWLNIGSNIRHNQSCKYFKNTKRGRLCKADEGKPCGQCGG